MRRVSSLFTMIVVAALVTGGVTYDASSQEFPAPRVAARLLQAPPPSPVPLFEPPEGLTMDLRRLLWELGYLDSPDSIVSNPLTYRFCLEVAVKCHVQRRYADSSAFAKRAITIRPTSSALYLQALNEIALGQSDDAVATLQRLKGPESVRIDYDWLREKLSGPLTARASLLLEVI